MRPLGDRFLRLFYEFSSGNRSSRAAGRLAQVRLPSRVLAPLIRAYCRAFRVDLSDAVVPAGGFRTFNDFFTRRLRPGARPVVLDPQVVVSPCDGLLTAAGTVSQGLALQAKGRFYPIASLLGDPEAARAFEGGTYATLYLSPRDYHRVHSPCDAQVIRVRQLPGRLYTVAPRATHLMDDLLPRNERVVLDLRTEWGPVIVCLVGAAGVGRITTPFCDLVSNSGDGFAPRAVSLDPPVPVRKGDDLGAFNVGSTVVLFLPPGTYEVLAPAPASPIRMGSALFRVLRP